MNRKHLKVKKIVVPVLTAYMVLLAAGNTTALALTETDLADIVKDQDTFIIEYVDKAKVERFEGIGAFAADVTTSDPRVTTITDIGNHWARENILFMVAKGGIKGYADHSFKPNNNISAAELASILIGASGNDNTVPSGNWANGIMEKARSLGITDIQNENGSKPISRELMADMLIRSAERLYNENTNNVDISKTSSRMQDYDKIDQAYRSSVSKCYELGLLQGQSGVTYNPKSSTTRGEAATICARLLDTEKRVSNVPKEGDDIWEGLLWIGDTITVNGVEYLIEEDPATGVIGRGIPAAIWEGFTYPSGYTLKIGYQGGMIKDKNFDGQPYKVDNRTGETHFRDEWMYIIQDIKRKVMDANGGKFPTDGSEYDIFGNKIEEGSDATVYLKCDPDGPIGYGPNPY